jgi:hypothetical protein
LELLLYGGVTLSGYVRHEISSEGDKEGKTVVRNSLKFKKVIDQTEKAKNPQNK